MESGASNSVIRTVTISRPTPNSLQKNSSQRFVDSWLNIPEYRSWLIKVIRNGKVIPYCTKCDKDVCCSSSGLKRHMNTMRHRRNERVGLKTKLAIDGKEIILDVDPASAKGPGHLSSILCTKNPGHRQFIPLPDLVSENLGAFPKALQQKTVVDYVKTAGSLVVKIGVTLISCNRPAVWQDGSSYPFADRRGQHVSNNGTGWVKDVEGPFPGNCPCLRCKWEEDECYSQYWIIRVVTTRVVVFDESEAKDCNIVFFEDHSDGRGRKIEVGADVISADTERDYCLLVFYTHNDFVGQRLTELFEERKEIVNRLAPVLQDYMEYNLPVFVVSHPHNRSKYITIGEDKGEDARTGSETLLYSAATCVGSSGGLVLPLRIRSAMGPMEGLVATTHSSKLAEDVGKSSDKLWWWWFG